MSSGRSVLDRLNDALVSYTNGDFEPVIRLCADDVEWTSCAGRDDVPFGGRYRGPSGVRTFFEQMRAATVLKKVVVKDVIAVGDTIITILELSPCGEQSQKEMGTRVVSRWTFEGGQLSRFEDYFDVKAALMSPLNADDARIQEEDGRYSHYKSEQAAGLLIALQDFFTHQRQPLLSMFAQDARFHSVSDAMFGLKDGIRGRDAIAKRVGGLLEAFKMQTFTVTDVIPAGDRVIHVGEIVFNERGNAPQQARFRVVGFWDFKDAEIVQYREYFNLEALLAELGRSQFAQAGEPAMV